MRKQIYINNREISYLTYHRTPEGCQIDDIFVEEKHRSEGYGKQLVEKLNKYEIIAIEINLKSVQCQKFWYRLGFREENGFYLKENKKPYINMTLFPQNKKDENIDLKNKFFKIYTFIFIFSLLLFAIYYLIK